MVKMKDPLVSRQPNRRLDEIEKVHRVAYLDGMRGLAILLVGAGHFFYKYPVFKSTWIGLNLFFVLSGYLITQRLFFHYKDSIGSYFKNFYFRRILRIFPLYYGCLFIFFIILPVLYSAFFTHFGELYSLQAWYWTYTSNWMIVFNGMPGQPLFFHFWSLAVEEQFYLLWPFLFLLLVRIKRNYLFVLGMIAASAFLRNYIGVNYSSFLNTGTVAEPLLLGALITILEKSKKVDYLVNYFLIVIFLALASLVIIFINNPDPEIVSNKWLFRVGYSSVDLFWASIILLSVSTNIASNMIKKLFSAKWLTWLGTYSYGIYVFHWIVLTLFIYKAETELIKIGMKTNVAYFLTRITGIAIVLLISYMSYHFYEKRFLRLKKKFA